MPLARDAAYRHDSSYWRGRSAAFSAAACCLFPPLLLYLGFRLGVQRKPVPGLWAKLTGSGPDTESNKLLLHGVSLGETALMRPVIARLEAQGERCLLTTSTSTGWQGLQKYPEHERQFFPFDLPWAVERFLSRTRPRAVILFDLELWPVWLLSCYRRGIPVIVANARMTARSFAGYRRAGAWLRPLFRGLRAVLGQNRNWTSRFRALGANRATTIGSLKADIVVTADADQRDAEAERLGLPTGSAWSKQILLGASTSEGEEAPLLASWQSWRSEHPYRLVLCPRHPERGASIAELCRARDLPYTRTSQLTDTPPPSDHVIIVDEIGRLAALYANARIAVVGGSLGSGRGGQNMLEAAAAGCCVVVGDDTRNQPDAMALLRAASGVTESSATGLDADLRRLLADPCAQQASGQRAQRAWHDGRGTAERLLAVLQELDIMT